MDELSRKFRSIDWKGIQRSARKMQASTASALKDMVMTDLENKVRAATSDTSWGASGSDLMQIAQGTFNREDYALIMSIVWQRLGSSRWRCVFKALEVLRFLIMHGAARCTEEARAASPHIQTLQHFRFVDPKTRRDHGEGVRTRAKLVCDMLADENVLEEEREKSKELRAKLQGGMGAGPGGRLGGLSSEDYQFGYGASSATSSSGVTTTSTGGAGNFKGYGDDDGDGNSGAYDDVPTGMFAKRVAGEGGNSAVAAADNMPDLLGDAPDEPSNEAGGLANDDDDDFDPRGTGAASGAAAASAGVDDLFGSLGLDDGDGVGGAAAPAHLGETGGSLGSGNGKPVPTSVLIQNLAQQQYGQQSGPLQPYQGQMVVQGGVSGVNGGGEAGGVGGGDTFGFDFGTGGAGSGGAGVGAGGVGSVNKVSGGVAENVMSKPAVASTPLVTSKADKDPFADLMDSAKKTGVL